MMTGTKIQWASLADVFEDRPELLAPRARLWRTILKTPDLDWLLLTKRPDVASRWLDDYVYGPAEFGDWSMTGDGGDVVPNAWIGVSCEDQARADERIPILLEIPAAVRFLSCEPLLSHIDLTRWLRRAVCDGCGQWLGRMDGHPADCHADTFTSTRAIDWVIVGGESGPKARPMDVAWARSIVEQCRAAGVACFVKQLGARPIGTCDRPRDPKGGEIEEFPADLRVREFPR